MNKYVENLDLDFDPFAAEAGFTHFYEGGNRDYLLDQLVQQSYYGAAITVVTAPLGSGKSTVAHWFQQSLDEDAVTVLLSASLFMTKSQLLENICEQLDVDCSNPMSDGELIAAIETECIELHSQSLYLQLIVDDAHELGHDVMQVVTDFYLNKEIDNFHVLLLGEKQLSDMLDTLLPVNALDDLVVRYQFDEFTPEEVAEYVTFKLSSAGYGTVLSLSPVDLTTIHNRSNGIPGAVNMLTVALLNRQQSGSTAASSTADGATHATGGSAKSGMPLPLMAKYLGAASVLGLALFLVMSFTAGQDQVGQPDVQLANAVAAPGRIQIPLGPAAADSDPASTLAAQADPIPVLDALPSIDQANAVLASAGSDESAESIVEATVAQPLAATSEPQIESRDTTVQPIPLLPQEAATDVQQAIAQQLPSEEPDNLVIAETIAAEMTVIEAEARDISAQAESALPVVADLSQVIAEPDATLNVPLGPEPGSYAQRILDYQPQNYTLQLLGSYSETSAQTFIEENTDSAGYAYFETRFQDRPWFVVVFGSFPDRNAATAAIATLPAAQQALEPWARLLGGIQEDVRKYWVQAN